MDTLIMIKIKLSSILCSVIFIMSAQCQANESLLSQQDSTDPAQQKSEMVNNAQVNAQDVFKKGYDLFKQDDWQNAATHFLRFIELTNEDETNFEWAEFFMGISLDKLGYTHAAMDRLANLAARKPNTRIVSYILEMFEQVSRNQPFDHDQIILQVVNDKDYGFINDDVSGFVHFYQGLQDWKTDHKDWAQDHFSKIPVGSYYHHRFLHFDALNQLQQNKPKATVKKLKALLLVENLDTKLADETRWTLARIFYQLKDWQQAQKMYNQIKTPVVEQASFLLERAWIAYQQQNYSQAMGYLYAFEAPSFKQFFTPEYFILKSFIYKDVCHFESALSISDEFTERYGASLSAIYDRKLASDEESEELLFVILTNPDVKRHWEFIQALESQRSQIHNIDYKDLKQHINTVYQLQIAQTSADLSASIGSEYKERANSLLKFEEAANLMRYEIGVDMYQSQARAQYDNNKDKGHDSVNKAPPTVEYDFQREYWNDELGHYQVVLPNKCKAFEEWELFF